MQTVFRGGLPQFSIPYKAKSWMRENELSHSIMDYRILHLKLSADALYIYREKYLLSTEDYVSFARHLLRQIPSVKLVEIMLRNFRTCFFIVGE